MTDIITLPGIGGSGKSHWQTYWEAQNPAIRRFQPSDWKYPDLESWMSALEYSIETAKTPPLLVAHSLACLLVAHWATRYGRPIRGAFLVSVPDPQSPVFPLEAASFINPPTKPFRFPSLIVASSNDPYGTLSYVKNKAKEWGSGFVIAGALGHINGSSGLSEWSQGAALLEAFSAGTAIELASANGT